MVETVEVMSVADLYVQYARFARHYDLADNPLTELTRRIPKRALFYAISDAMDTTLTETMMKRLAGRRKLRSLRVHKDDIKHPAFSPTEMMVIYYA